MKNSATAGDAGISRIGFIIGEILFLVAAQTLGGPPWTLVGTVALVLLSLAGPRLATLAFVAPSLLWIGASQATGNRELFFPYAMHAAAVVVCRLSERGPAQGFAAGGIVVATFLAIRAVQRAAPPVLAVECAVAVAILAGATLVCARCPRRAAVDAAVVAAAALCGYAGLAL